MFIRSILAASLAFLCSACVTPDEATPGCGDTECVTLGEPFETIGASITPLELLEDSRCPADAECIWPGQIRIRALVERDGREREITLTDKRVAPVLSGNLELTRIWPDRTISTGKIAPEAYRFRFSWTPILLDAQR